MKENLTVFREYISKIQVATNKLCDALNKNLEFDENVLNLLKQQNEVFKQAKDLPKDKYFNLILESIEDRYVLYFNENYLKTPKICLAKNRYALSFSNEMLNIIDESIKKLTDCEFFILQ